MKNLFLILIVLFAAAGCHNNKIQNDIKGIWCLERGINKQFVNDDGFYDDTSPIIFDFQNSKKLRIKNLGSTDTIAKYSLSYDSTFEIFHQQYKINNINQDELIIEHPNVDTLLYFFKRTKEANVTISVDSVKKLLKSNRWSASSTSNMTNYNWLSDFEFFDNEMVMFRYKKENGEDNLQQERWNIESYKGQLFFYLKSDIMKGFGNIDLMYQITQVNSDSINLWDHYSSQPLTFRIKNYNINEHAKKTKSIIGTWISQNDTTKTYWKHISEEKIKSGRQIKFNGKLKYIIKENGIIKIILDEKEILEGKWELSKDARILLISFDAGTELGYGEVLIIRYSDVLSLDEFEMKIKLYDYIVHQNAEDPILYLNIFQDFKKLK